MIRKIINWVHPDSKYINEEFKQLLDTQAILSVKYLGIIFFILSIISSLILIIIPTAKLTGFQISLKFFIISVILFLTFISPYKAKISKFILLIILFYLIADNIYLQLNMFSRHKTQLGLFIASLCFLTFTFLPFRSWVVGIFGIFGISMIIIFSLLLNIEINPYRNTTVFWLISQFSALTLVTFFFRSAIFNMQINIFNSHRKISNIEKELKDIKSLLFKEESSNLEYKASFRYDYKKKRANAALENSVIKSIAGFLNTNGGTIIIGVDDNKKIIGLKNDYITLRKKNSDGFQLAIINAVSSKIGAEFCKYLKFNFFTIDNKEICSISITSAKEPAYVKLDNNTIFYIRTGNSTQALDTKKAVEYINKNW